jgi:RNA polymerase sigma factor (sigma-70 family)
MREKELNKLIAGCINQDRISQKKLYISYYGFAIGTCRRYGNNREQAAEIMNKGFFIVFANIACYKEEKTLKDWIGKIMINISVDHYRPNLKTNLQLAYEEEPAREEQITDCEPANKYLNYGHLLSMVQQLSPGYKIIFNLYAIDKFSHDEIATLLKITADTSRSILIKARKKLKEMLHQMVTT